MTRSVLVTGGAGSLGRLVTRRLRAAEATVRVFDLPSADYAGLDGEPGIEVVRGDLTSVADAGDAVADVGAIVHLAAVLPPLADRDRALTMHVNVDGTRVLLEAAAGTAPEARFVFSSSVSVYGDTITGVEEFREIAIDRPAAPDDVYAESKAASEELVQESDLAWVVLRLSGVAVPAFQEPPAEWPFTSDQRIEFVHRDDAVAALASALDTEGAERRVFNVSGGASWRMTGERYVADYFEIVGVDPKDAVYQRSPGHFDWYDSAASQPLLGYQNTPYRTYLDQIQADVDRLLAG